MLSFPDWFTWGVATAAYQIEGAVDDGGRGRASGTRSRIHPAGCSAAIPVTSPAITITGGRSDIGLMKRMGASAYRFSIAWPRACFRTVADGSTGTASASTIGSSMAFLEAGITPYPTLYHWDLPQVLDDEGGWSARGTAEAFADYCTCFFLVIKLSPGSWVKNG